MYRSIIIPLLFSYYTGFSQLVDSNCLSLEKQISSNFSYDLLSSISCLNAPVGVYAISFKMDKNGSFYAFRCSADSLKDLNKLFIAAIKKSRFGLPEPSIKQGRETTFLQIIFFNNISHCNDYLEKDNVTIKKTPDTITFSDPPYYKEINVILTAWLGSIKKSFSSSMFANIDQKNVFVLPPATIYWPGIKQTGKSFKNDVKEGVSDINKLSPEERKERECLLKRLEEIKKEKAKQKQ